MTYSTSMSSFVFWSPGYSSKSPCRSFGDIEVGLDDSPPVELLRDCE